MINISSLKTLEDEIGSEDFMEVATLFLSEMDEAVSKLPQITDAVTMGDTLHFLKGASLNLGLTAFSELCISGEASAKTGKVDAIDVTKISAVYHASRAQLTEYLGGSGTTA
ncbi:Hpt domain-containing protein [Celeribacter sp.]|uniref:Hpt domain-containing protein n=1 Tax=Celeribacter sp. TaxID=1890673 RepID=UPI003A930B23